MDSLRNLVVRDDHPSMNDDSQDEMFSPTMNTLLIVLFCLVIAGMTCVTALFVLRSIRRKRAIKNQQLPSYHTGRRPQHRRNLTITATPYGPNAAALRINEKEYLDSPRSSGPQSPVPEIHITFPEEEDRSGRRQSGRVVVVRISDNGGVGLEPYPDNSLPPYQQRDGENWKSLDLERLGGLKEKEHGKQWS